MGDIITPYIAGEPFTEAQLFIGRQVVFDWIEKSISGQSMEFAMVGVFELIKFALGVK
jgi:hypothetical protein